MAADDSRPDPAAAAKEIRQILKRINPDLKRLLELTDSSGAEDSVLVQAIRSGARSLRIARRIVKQQ